MKKPDFMKQYTDDMLKNWELNHQAKFDKGIHKAFYSNLPTQDLIKEFKKRGIGVYPLELPFASIPKPE